MCGRKYPESKHLILFTCLDKDLLIVDLSTKEISDELYICKHCILEQYGEGNVE
jgi:hypothetical protein